MRAEQEDEPDPFSVLTFAHLVHSRPEPDHKTSVLKIIGWAQVQAQANMAAEMQI